MSAIKRGDDGEIRGIFTSQESHVLINLTEQLIELLGDGSPLDGAVNDPFHELLGLSSNDLPPEDPVLLRLLPNAYKDENESAEFRRYTEHGLRQKKRAHALTIYEALLPQDEEWNADAPLDRASIEISIPESEVMAWLGGFNDLRIALAVRLGIGESSDVNKDHHQRLELMREDDPMQAVYAVYNWLGGLQQSLLDALSVGGDDHQPT